MVVGQKVAPAQCNFSHQDQIWKDYVKKEVATSKKRNKDYSFLLQEYQTLQKDVFELRARHSGQQPTQPKVATDKPENKEQSEATTTDHDLKLPPLEAPPQDTSNPFPLMTSREIGWRSDRKYNLEVYGRWGRPKHSIIKQLKWPVDAVP